MAQRKKDEPVVQDIKELANEIIYNGRKFVFDFETLTIEQVELARELGEFKAHQNQQRPERFEEVISSGGTEWLPTLMCFLLREEVNGTLLPFNLEKARNEIEVFVRNLPAVYLGKIRRIVESFFQITGLSETGSQILHGKRKLDAQEMLLRLMMENNFAAFGKKNT